MAMLRDIFTTQQPYNSNNSVLLVSCGILKTSQIGKCCMEHCGI